MNNYFIIDCERGNLDYVKSFVENGGDISIDDHECMVAASTYGHFEVVKYLVENGADVHSNDDYALIHFSMLGNLEAVKFLLEKGADACSQDFNALDCANEYACLGYQVYPTIVKLLVQHGADIKRVSPNVRRMICM